MKSNPQGKRFVPVSEYQRTTGLSYKTVMHMLRTGQIKHIVTESGQYRIDTHETTAQGNSDMKNMLEETQRQVQALCKQFNVAV